MTDVVYHNDPPEEPVEPLKIDPEVAQHEGADENDPADWVDDDA